MAGMVINMQAKWSTFWLGLIWVILVFSAFYGWYRHQVGTWHEGREFVIMFRGWDTKPQVHIHVDLSRPDVVFPAGEYDVVRSPIPMKGQTLRFGQTTLYFP